SSPLVRVIVAGPPVVSEGSNVIVLPGQESIIACRTEPAPLSFVLVTTCGVQVLKVQVEKLCTALFSTQLPVVSTGVVGGYTSRSCPWSWGRWGEPWGLLPASSPWR